jgi:hypothetical protein
MYNNKKLKLMVFGFYMSNFYCVEGFIPPYEGCMGRWRFAVYLDSRWVRGVLSCEIQEKGYENLQRMRKEIIKKVPKLTRYPNHVREPYGFVLESDKVTCLLQICTVSGDVCTPGIGFMEVNILPRGRCANSDILYSPRNVDIPLQTYALFSLRSNWAVHAGTYLPGGVENDS